MQRTHLASPDLAHDLVVVLNPLRSQQDATVSPVLALHHFEPSVPMRPVPMQSEARQPLSQLARTLSRGEGKGGRRTINSS